MRNRGFSLIELVIVLVLVGLSAALVAPSLSRFSKKVELKAAAQKVSAILRFSRSESVQKGKVYQILLDPDSREVRVRAVEEEGSEEGRIEGTEGAKGTEAPGFAEKRYPLPEGIFIKEVKVPPPGLPSDLPAIEFYPTGGSSGGSFLLETSDQRGFRIKVHFLTGMVEIEAA